jgi:ubiquinone/menaquinone biosynthesis C-methylase UbiE
MLVEQHPRHQHIIRTLQNHNIQRGSVLVVGEDPKSLTLLLERLQFEVQSLSLDRFRDTHEGGARVSNGFSKPFDIIILDHLLQFLPHPYATLRLFGEQLAKGGVLVVASPNAARGTMRFKGLMGKNVYPYLNGEDIDKTMMFDYVKAFYRENTLEEIRTLLSKESFVILDEHCFNGNDGSNHKNYVAKWAYRGLQKMVPSFRNDLFFMARGNFTNDVPTLRKVDPFKITSMHVFNSKWLRKYDTPTLFNRAFTKRWDKEVLMHLPNNIGSLRILDVGCGWGRLLTRLADVGARQLAGMDLAPRMVELVRQRLAERGVKADIQVADAEDRIPWENDSFDVITLTGGFHHLYRPMDALQEVYRVLKKNGHLIITDPYFFPPVRQILNYLCSLKGADGDYRFYTPEEVSKMVESAGFIPSQKRLWLNSLTVTASK